MDNQIVVHYKNDELAKHNPKKFITDVIAQHQLNATDIVDSPLYQEVKSLLVLSGDCRFSEVYRFVNIAQDEHEEFAPKFKVVFQVDDAVLGPEIIAPCSCLSLAIHNAKGRKMVQGGIYIQGNACIVYYCDTLEDDASSNKVLFCNTFEEFHEFYLNLVNTYGK